jgi:hypothetical protein
MEQPEGFSDIDLISAVQDALKRRGVYSKVKATIRAEVFNVLEDKTVPLPNKPQDVFVASELIKEFLILFKLNNTLSVFCEEMGQPSEMTFDRELIGAELGLNTLGTDPKIPLLIMLIEYLKRNRADFACHVRDSLQGEAGSEIDFNTDPNV